MTEARYIEGAEAAAARLLAREWFKQAPAWLRAADAADVEADTADSLHFGIWTDGRLVALLRFTELQPCVFEMHLDAERGSNVEAICSVTAHIADAMMDKAGAVVIFAWVLKHNRVIRRMLEGGNAYWDGARRLKGTHRGRSLEWLRYARWGKGKNDGQKAADINHNQQLRLLHAA